MNPSPHVRAHIMSSTEYHQHQTGQTKDVLQVKQEIKDMYKGTEYDAIDVYSPDEELLYRVTLTQ